MIKKLVFIFILVFFIPYIACAQAQILTIDLAKNHVDINTGFHGTYLQIYGVKETGGDVAVIIKGPLKTMNVRRKEKVFGAWVNKTYETFEQVPSFYSYAASAPLEQLAAPEILEENQIGIDHIQFQVKTDKIDAEKLLLFRKALIRNKQHEGLFSDHAEEIVFLNPDFFRTQFYIPANVPMGQYKVESYYFQNGLLKDTKVTILKVGQVGFSAQIYEFAKRKRFLYALFCIGLALFAGWFSNRVRFK